MCIDGIGAYIAGYAWLAVTLLRGQLSYSVFESSSLHGGFGRLHSGADACTCTLFFTMEST